MLRHPTFQIKAFNSNSSWNITKCIPQMIMYCTTWLSYSALLSPRVSHTVESLTNDHPHQRPSLSYDHISCDGQWFLFVYESLTSDHPSYTTTPMWFWWWSYKRGSTVLGMYQPRIIMGISAEPFAPIPPHSSLSMFTSTTRTRLYCNGRYNIT